MANRCEELPKDKLISFIVGYLCSLITSSALVLLEHGYRVKELYGGIAAWETLRFPEEELGSADSAA